MIKKKKIPDTLPHSQTVELASLSAMLGHKTALARGIEKLGEEDYHISSHKTLFTTFRDLFQNGVEFDQIAFVQHLYDKNLYEEIGSIVVAELSTMNAVASMMDSYIMTLKEKSLLRKIISACTTAKERAHLEQAEIDEILGDVQTEILQLRKYKLVETPTIAQDLLAKLERMENGEPEDDIIKTWLKDLDEKSPLHKGDMPLVCGKKKSGKTIFALTLLENICISQRRPGLYFSLEDRRKKVMDRIFAGVSRIPMHRHHVKAMSEGDLDKCQNAIKKIQESNLIVHDDAFDLSQIISIAKQEIAKNPNMAVMCADYAQLIRTPPKKGGSREQEVATVSRAFRLLAMETGVPIILLSQLNRDGISRESSSLENDCTARWDIEGDEDEPMSKERTIRIPFQRNGVSGEMFTVNFMGEIARVENMAREKE